LLPLAVVIEETQSEVACAAAHRSSRSDIMADGRYSVKCWGGLTYIYCSREDDAVERSVLHPKYRFYQQPDVQEHRVFVADDKQHCAQSKKSTRSFNYSWCLLHVGW
jgi:hypothetical protein